MDYSTLGSSILHYFPEFAQIHVHWVGDAIQPSYPLSPTSPPALKSFAAGGQIIGASALASVLLMNIQDYSAELAGHR